MLDQSSELSQAEFRASVLAIKICGGFILFFVVLRLASAASFMKLSPVTANTFGIIGLALSGFFWATLFFLFFRSSADRPFPSRVVGAGLFATLLWFGATVFISITDFALGGFRW